MPAVSSSELRKDRARRPDLLAERHPDARFRRKIDVDAGAEPDEAEAVAAAEAVAGFRVAEDPARDQPGDLDAGDVRAGVGLEPQRAAFVLRRGLVERRVHERPRVVPG